MKKKIYVAGAYTNGDVAFNVKKAIELGDALAAIGYSPYIPHLNHFWHMIHDHEAEFWYEHDLEWLAVCDGMVILEPVVESVGVEREIEFANSKKIPWVMISCQEWIVNDLHTVINKFHVEAMLSGLLAPDNFYNFEAEPLWPRNTRKG